MHVLTVCYIAPQVVEGFEIVKAIEGCGSRSGETAYDVMVAGCGQLRKGEGQ
jgi:peptidyl-prolyl isomerase F (cyclophilin D)